MRNLDPGPLGQQMLEQDWRARIIEEHALPQPPRWSFGDDVRLGLRVMFWLFIGWLIWSVWPEAPLYLGAVVALAWAVGWAIHRVRP